MILTSPWVIPISSACIEDGAIVVENGQIIDIGGRSPIRTRHPDHQVRHYPNAVLMPGFVNVHTHLELSVLRGYLEGLSFWKWIRQLTKTKYEILTHEDIAVSALLGAIEAIQSGITTIADPMDLGGSLDAVLTTGLRGVLYQEVFSPKPEDVDRALEGLKSTLGERRLYMEKFPTDSPLTRFFSGNAMVGEVVQVRRNNRIFLGVSPHAPYTVSAPLFSAVERYAKVSALPVCIHLGESNAEKQFLGDGTGPIGKSYRERGIPWIPPKASPVQYLDRLGVINKSTLLVHCIYLEDQDFEILQARKATVAHCPKSNAKLGQGFMNLKAMRERQIPVGIGTDSVASNDSMDMCEEMRFSQSNPWIEGTYGDLGDDPDRAPGLTSMELLRMATLGGAEALGLADRIGSLEVGKQADIVAIDLSGYHVQPVFSPTESVVFSARASDTRMTMVEGEVLYQDGVIPGFKPRGFLKSVQEIRKKMLNARRHD